MRIRTLLVDDSPETLEAMALLYSTNPEIEVVGTAKSSAEAVTILESTSINLVSIDIHLRDDNGFRLCSQIHQRYPIVFITMCSLEDDDFYRTVAERAGAQYYLAKPITLDDIWSLVHLLQQIRVVDSSREDLGVDALHHSDWITTMLSKK